MINLLNTAADLHFEEVYVTDIYSVKHFFNKLHGRPKNAAIGADFGVPFLLAKKGLELVGFASMVISKDGEKHLKVFLDPTLDAQQKQLWQTKAQQDFDRRFGQSGDNKQLKHKIVRWVNWMNNAVA